MTIRKEGNLTTTSEVIGDGERGQYGVCGCGEDGVALCWLMLFWRGRGCRATEVVVKKKTVSDGNYTRV